MTIEPSSHKDHTETHDDIKLNERECTLLRGTIACNIMLNRSSFSDFDRYIKMKEQFMTELLTSMLNRQGTEEASEQFTKLLTIVDESAHCALMEHVNIS